MEYRDKHTEEAVLKERIERMKELHEEMRNVYRLARVIVILLILLAGSNAVWLYISLFH